MEYKNILLKLSGEAIAGKDNIISKEIFENIFLQVKELVEKHKVKVSIVIGGGNIIRGVLSDSLGMGSDTSAVDYMGILATTINALALKAYFNNHGLKTEVLNSLKIENVVEKYKAKKAKKLLEEGNVLIFGGGTGKPYVSTDTAAAIRAREVDAEAILMAKNGVDGAFSDDPKVNKDAIFYDHLKFDQIIEKDLKVIDHEMVDILKNRGIDVILFNMKIKNNIINLYTDKNIRKTIIGN